MHVFERLWEKTCRPADGTCWFWTAGVSRSGRGVLWVDGRGRDVPTLV